MSQGETGTLGGYRIERVLGRGGMGAVYLARAPDGARVAIKLLHAQGDRSLQRFLRERVLGTRLEHPGLVRVLGGGVHQEHPYLVMEYLAGRTLDAVLQERRRLPPEEVVVLARQLADGLGYLHARGITHRDLKPENLMLDEGGRLKIMDLGLAKLDEGTVLTATGSVLGTPWYLAPEQVGGKDVTPAADLFSFALLLYLLLTGHHPLRQAHETDFIPYLKRLAGAEPRPWHPDGTGGPLDLFFRRGLARDPGARFGSAALLVAGFEDALDQQRRGPRTVEETLEVDASIPPAPRPAPPRGAGAGGPEPVAGGPGDSPVPGPRAGFRLWLPALVAAALAGAGWWVVARHGAGPPPDLIQATEGLATPEGRVVLFRLARPWPLTARGGRLEAGTTVRLLRVDPGAAVVELTAGGETVWSQDPAAMAWRETGLPSRWFDRAGDLVVSRARSPWGELSLRRGSGTRIADSSKDPGKVSFRVPDPDRRGLAGLELVLAAGGSELLLARLPAEESAPGRLTAFLARLAAFDPVAAVVADGAAAARDRLERDGLVREYRMLRRVMAARLEAFAPGDRDLRAMALGLPRLGLLEAALRHEGAASPFDLRKHRLSRPLRLNPLRWADPKPSPREFAWPLKQDYFLVTLPEEKAFVESPETLIARDMPVVTLAAPPPGPGWPWLVIHARRADAFAAKFFAVATVNGQGPFYLFESPRRDLAREAAAKRPDYDWFDLRFKVRVPPDMLGADNKVALVFRPWHYQKTDFEHFVAIRAVGLEPGRPEESP